MEKCSVCPDSDVDDNGFCRCPKRNIEWAKYLRSQGKSVWMDEEDDCENDEKKAKDFEHCAKCDDGKIGSIMTEKGEVFAFCDPCTDKLEEMNQGNKISNFLNENKSQKID